MIRFFGLGWKISYGGISMSKNLAMLALISAFLLSTRVHAADTLHSSQQANPVIEWNRTLLTIVRTPGAQPSTVHSTRNFAILHAAIYDAVTNIEPHFNTYLVHLPEFHRNASTVA